MSNGIQLFKASKQRVNFVAKDYVLRVTIRVWIGSIHTWIYSNEGGFFFWRKEGNGS